ncbi:MAG: NADH-quinone oxidoreductase subunit J [Cyclobacteriaceae bacterium]|nr:NADH-quinone oxidoreductase subunit J [Cyclobacteriaceae bacterium]UYN87866.1 MAG: NADH-quinone oxidoreductase subunit J [Cyclobacteriaceae bacterium]
MATSAIIFYTISGVMIIFSLLAVTSRRILRAAVYLLFALAGTAALYFMVDYQFLAAVQLIVYAGGIVVLIIFSILLTTHINEKLEKPAWGKVFITATLALGGLVLTLFILTNHEFVLGTEPLAEATVSVIGERLLGYKAGGYVLPFEVISILLLAAMVGAIVIAKRNATKS